MNRRERRTVKGSSINRSSATEMTPAELYAAGLEHLSAGRPLDAQVCAQRAVVIDPEHAGSLHLMGLLALHAGQHGHAVEWLTRAVRQAPNSGYLASLGIALKGSGRLDDALRVFDKAVQLAPEDAEQWKNLAGVLVALDRRADALLAYRQALRLNPHHWEAACQTGVLLHEMERFEEAVHYFKLCDELRPDHAPALLWRARSLRGLERYEECLADNKRAHALAPDNPVICNNVGDALLQLNRFEEGLTWFDKALALEPERVDVLLNKGFALNRLGRFSEAVAIYRRASARDPNNARARYELAHLELLMGNFEAGWAAREARWSTPGFSPEYPRFAQPKWLGEESVEGKTVLVHVDEGLGDTIQFTRFVPQLVQRGARVILVVQDALVPLLSGVPGIAACLPFSASLAGRLPAFDMHCPIMSLPLAFGATLETIPPPIRLPPVPPERLAAWDQRLPPRDRLRVGLVWSGNPNQGNDRNRSMPLATLLPLLDADATFVSLQKDPRPDDKALLRTQSGIIDLTADLTDFAETAALVSCLDLVVSVCTSVAHLAATLGRPTWVMLPYIGDWRWLVDRDDSPWYPSVRLFRQDETRSYAGVVARVRAELAKVISGRNQIRRGGPDGGERSAQFVEQLHPVRSAGTNLQKRGGA